MKQANHRFFVLKQSFDTPDFLKERVVQNLHSQAQAMAIQMKMTKPSMLQQVLPDWKKQNKMAETSE